MKYNCFVCLLAHKHVAKAIINAFGIKYFKLNSFVLEHTVQRSVVMATAQRLTFVSTFCQSHPRSRCSVLLRLATRCNLSARNELMLLIIALNQSHSQRGHINNYSNTCAYTHISIYQRGLALSFSPSLALCVVQTVNLFSDHFTSCWHWPWNRGWRRWQVKYPHAVGQIALAECVRQSQK